MAGGTARLDRRRICFPASSAGFPRIGSKRLVLLKTFCETRRFQGTCYRAANRIDLGEMQGRGQLDTRSEFSLPIKNIFGKPLCPDWKAILSR